MTLYHTCQGGGERNSLTSSARVLPGVRSGRALVSQTPPRPHPSILRRWITAVRSSLPHLSTERHQGTQKSGEGGSLVRAVGRGGDRDEGGMRALKANFCKKAKRKLERFYKGSEWLTVLPIYQDGTDISMEELMDALQWKFDIPLHNTPLTCDGQSDPFIVDCLCRCKRGGACRNMAQYPEQGLVGDVRGSVKPRCSDQ